MKQKLNKTCALLLIVFSQALNLVGQEPDIISPYISQPPTPEQQARVNAAFAAMEAVQKAGAYVESIADLVGNQEMTLPVGIKKGGYELIVQKIKHNKNTGKADIYATCAFKFKDNGQKIAFEGLAGLEGQNGIGTHGSLELIAPVSKKLGEQATVVFCEGTKVGFGCEGIELFDAKMKFAVISKKVIEVKPNGEPTGNPLIVGFGAQFSDLENYTASFNIDRSFKIEGLKDVLFNLKGATIDQSDVETSSMARFPKGYFASGDGQEVKLWKGVAFTEASVSLPGFFNNSKVADSLKSKDNNRIVVGMVNSIFDENGFSGEVFGEGIIPSEGIDPANWDISLTGLSLLLIKNEIKGFGFSGDINLPPLGKNSLLGYSAKFNIPTHEYDFFVEVEGDYEFPVLKSTLTLHENSGLEIQLRDSQIYPTLRANGTLTVNAPLSEKDSAKKFSVPDITFEEMRISRDVPHFSVGALGVTGDLRPPEIGGFQVYLDSIRPFKNEKGEGLAFDAGIKLNKSFGGEAGVQLYGDYSQWKFDHVGIDKVSVDYKSAAYCISGTVMFKNGDKIYGSGFRGDVMLKAVDKFEFAAVAVFGKKENYRYFLTDVFFEATPATGFPVPPFFTFYGFGGGMYRRMQQSYGLNIDTGFGKSLSGINYVPDREVGLGLMASTKFALLGSEAAMNAKVTFEMQFNRHGGLNFVQLRGDAAMMDMPDKMQKLSDDIEKAMEQYEKAGGEIKQAQKGDLKAPANKGSSFLTASMNMKYDFTNKVFTADMNSYLDAGFMKGRGPNGRMGWASAYYGPDKWYAYIGTPSDRMGINMMGLAQMGSYFMIGDDIPELPPPPAEVLQNFSQEKQERLNTRNSDQLALGKGLAFGKSFEIDIDATMPPFYARLGLGIGAEFLLKNYGKDAYCFGSTSTLGVNGWYAKGQAWAYVDADIGMEAKVFRKKRKFSVLDISAGALLTGSAPNPVYLSGMVSGEFSIMGGLLSGQCDFEFELGEECIVKGGSPFGEDIIAELTPVSGEKDVNVFTTPQAVFNIPIGLEMEIDEDGEMVMYKVTLEEFNVKYKGSPAKLEGYTSLSSDGMVYAFDPDEPFESHKDMVVYAKVGFKRKLNGKWIDVKDTDGTPAYEEKQEEFISGERPSTILPKHVKYSYPMPRQYNFYPDEHDEGYILITENYAYLFSTDKPEGFKQALRVSDMDGNKWETGFSYTEKNTGEDIRLEINFPLKDVAFGNDGIYKMAIVNVPINSNVDISSNVSSVTTAADSLDNVNVTTQQAEGTIQKLEEKEVYAHHFRTSKYNTFDEKLAEQDVQGTGWRKFSEPYVHHVKANITDDEFFDYYEMQWHNGDFPMVQFEAELDKTNWYKKSFYKNMYAINIEKDIKDKRQKFDPDFNKLGFPPKRAVEIQNITSDRKLADDEIETGIAGKTFAYGNFTYEIPYWCARDLKFIKEELALKVAMGNSLTKEEEEVMATSFPPVVTKGNYPVKIKYVLPGKNIATSTIDIKMYNPID